MNKNAPIQMAGHLRPSFGSKFLTVSADGRIRVSFGELLSIRFTHLISGLDEDCPEMPFGDVLPTTICGYTEWVSDCDPKISIGWDWLIHERDQLRRVGEPRSNVMFQTNLRDISHAQLPALLGEFVDTLAWQAIVLNHIIARYR